MSKKEIANKIIGKNKQIKIPKILFKNGWLLSNAFAAYMHEIEKYKDHKAPSYEEGVKIAEQRKKLWKKYEKIVVTAMQKITGLNFSRDIIDTYTVFGWKGAFSEPLVIGMYYQGEDFLDVLTHELIHVLLVDNIQKRNGGIWPKKIYPKIKDKNAIFHILVHAIHKEIYLNVLKRPDRLEHDLKNAQNWPSYKMAWDIVERDGHMNIIEKFKKSK